MNQEEWSKIYLDKDEPFDLWKEPDQDVYADDAGYYFPNDTVGRTMLQGNSTQGTYVSDASKKVEKAHFPFVTIMIIVTNVIAGVLCLRAGKDYFSTGGVNYEYITTYHEYGRFISYMFLHAGFEHLANNMVCMWVFGYSLEKRFGSLRTMIIYFASGIGAGIVSTYVSHAINPSQTRFCIGASGAVFGIICASIFMDKMRDVGKAKQKDMVTSIVIVVIFALISMRANVDIYGHIAGAVIGGISAFALNVKKWENYRENAFMKLVGIIICLWFCIMGIGEAGIGRDAKKYPDERVDYIKEKAIFVDDDDVSFGEGLDYYCSDAEWNAFVSTENEDIVQFDGKARYQGKERALMIQFVVDVENDEFSLCYFAFDDEAQTTTTANDFFTILCNRYRSIP